MFDLSIEKIAVLGVLALFILGPERLPGAMSWLGRTIRQVKDYAAGAREHLEGPEFDELREPLNELRGPLQELRALRDPRAAVARHLFDHPPSQGDAPAEPATATGTTAIKPVTQQAAPDHMPPDPPPTHAPLAPATDPTPGHRSNPGHRSSTGGWAVPDRHRRDLESTGAARLWPAGRRRR